MLDSKFIHLRTHSSYSLCEGAIEVKKLIGLAQNDNMPAIGLCDSNNLFGALEFSSTATGGGVQPIVGIQLNITPIDTDNFNQSPTPDEIVLLAKDNDGYLNLMKLISHSFVETENNITPQISLDMLLENNKGLICLTGGDNGTANRLFKAEQDDKALDYLNKLKSAFDDRLYVELTRYKNYNVAVEEKLLDYAFDNNVPIVATNNVFFAEPKMEKAHDALLCIGEASVVGQSDRRHTNGDLYFKSAEEMAELFSDLPEAIQNTVEIAKRCYFKVNEIDPLLPKYPYLEGRTEQQALYDLTKVGLENRLKNNVLTDSMTEESKADITKQYFDRMDYELGVINEMGFPGYFLIVADFIGWTKKENIPVGPGRGSGAGSIVAWSLDITNLDPIRFGLLFERFLNPERVSMPDFDIDFCQDRREEVIEYVQKQYGTDKVAQIITFGKLQARAVVRDVGRVLSVPYGQVDGICKIIPNNPAKPVTLAQAMETEIPLQTEVKSDPTTEYMVETALKLEGLYRHASTHAAGLVIGDRPLNQLVPLYRDPKSELPVTQFNMKWVEQAGLVKFDFLGLKTLTIIQMAVDLANSRDDVTEKIDIDNIELDDAPSYELMAKGNTVGIFQLESPGMRKVLIQMKPDKLEDIIAVISLYRPGPMENIPQYVDCKHDRKQPKYLHPALEPILKETFGIPVYQEQVMQMAQTLAGYTLGGADLLRRAMGKKIQAEMDEQRQIFKDGAKQHNQVDEKLADAIFDQINAFAGYGFNKSHAAAYALIGYQTAWLKSKYPVEFMASLMSYGMGDTDNLASYRDDLIKNDIELLPPDVNKSFAKFSVEKVGDKRAVRYALCGLKNVGESAVAELVEARGETEFADIYDFFARVPYTALNKRMVESLVNSGAFDSLHSNRNELFQNLEELLKYGRLVQDEANSSQDSLFGESDVDMAKPKIIPAPDKKQLERLADEYSAVGFYLSDHPLSVYADKWDRLDVVEYGDILRGKSGDRVVMAGVIMGVNFRNTKKGNPMVIIDLSDASGSYSAVMFDSALESARDYLKVGKFVFLDGTKQVKNNEGEKEVRITANIICDLEEKISQSAEGLQIYVGNKSALGELKNVISNMEKGRGIIKLIMEDASGRIEMKLGEKHQINNEIINSISNIDGITEVNRI